MTIDTQITAEIVEKIRERDRKSLISIYKDAYPMMEKYIISNSGSKADAQDLFQDAMYVLIKKVENPDFTLTSKVSTFLFGIGKNLWLKQLTKHKIDAVDLQRESEMDQEIDEKDFHQLTRVRRMKECLIALGEPCRTILEQFYFLKTPMKRIAEMLHYTNANNAKNQKYKCLVRLKKSFETSEKTS